MQLNKFWNKTIDSRKIFLFVDVHGHSFKNNVLMHGCPNPKNSSDKTIILLPIIMSRNHSSFSYDDWNFKVQKDKLTTGRAVVNREYKVINSFTLEASFFGPDIGNKKGCHFTPTQYREVGRKFWISLHEFGSEKTV